MTKKVFTIRRYDGDSIYSWAVFRVKDVENIKQQGNMVFYGQARPVVCGVSRHLAIYYRDKFEHETPEV
jgi:hypothetical protein